MLNICKDHEVINNIGNRTIIRNRARVRTVDIFDKLSSCIQVKLKKSIVSYEDWAISLHYH